MKSKVQCSTNRLIGLDIFRIISVFLVFLFHSSIHLGCNYGFLNKFINMGAIFMTAFFILSGYTLYLTYQKIILSEISYLKSFYLKRLLVILPLYYAVSIIYILFLGTDDYKTNIVLAPIEILGLQSTFSTIFNVSHNGGTWFVSCILLCYLIYPFIQEVTKQITNRCKVVVIILCGVVLLWSPFVVNMFNTVSIYANPFFRLCEFTIGVMLCAMKNEIENSHFLRGMFSWVTIVLAFAVLIIGVTLAVKLGVFVGDYMMYSWVALPIFSLLIVSMSGIKVPLFKGNNLVKYLCEISYAFFLAQFFTWKTTRCILSAFGVDNNIVKIVLSFLICITISIMLHEIIEKPITNYLSKILFKCRQQR